MSTNRTKASNHINWHKSDKENNHQQTYALKYFYMHISGKKQRVRDLTSVNEYNTVFPIILVPVIDKPTKTNHINAAVNNFTNTKNEISPARSQRTNKKYQNYEIQDQFETFDENYSQQVP